MLSHDAVIARVNFAIVIAKNCLPTVERRIGMELGVGKEIESLLAEATVDDLYSRDWTAY